MKTEEFRTENLGGNFNIDSNGASIIGDLIVRRESLTKSHSIIALNLQTVDDVEQVIRQCEALKGQMTNGLEVDQNSMESAIIKHEFKNSDSADSYKILAAKVIIPASVIEKD